MPLSKAAKLKLCSGCRDNRYNQPAGYRETSIDAPVSGDGCYSLANATLCNKMVYYSSSQTAPTLRERTLSCWHNDFGYGTNLGKK
jgi:hypothetical protein